MLGAAGLGDIGQHFPDNDPEHKGAPSRKFAEHVIKLLAMEGLRIVNTDITIVLEHPKILPFKDEMRRILAGICGLELRRVSIKATTNERVGCIGRGEAVAAFAVCLTEPSAG
jgi:2-C-methyl-D-erythritol 2,4-cyclodiphosphate synthase